MGVAAPAAAVGAGTSSGTAIALGITGLLKEVVGEVGDIVEQVIDEMGKCILWEETVIIREHPRANNKQKVTCETRVRHYKITLFHAFMLYAALRMAGILPPLRDWPAALKGEHPWYTTVFGIAGGTAIEAFNEWVRPDSVPPIPADAVYDPWWGTYTHDLDAPFNEGVGGGGAAPGSGGHRGDTKEKATKHFER